VEGKIKIPGVATIAGRRMLLPVGLFQAGHPALFRPEKRVNPIYFRYPFQQADEVTLHLPEGFSIESIPPASPARPGNVFEYELSCTKDANSIHVHRREGVERNFIPAQYYPQVRGFFQTMRARDEQQIVLQSAQGAGGQ
jgi:hypothetical protein